MFDDEFVAKPSRSVKRNLTDMSVEELEDYIVELQSEIKRSEDDITKKKASMDAANSVFK